MFVYIGAYTDPPLGRARGIAVYRFDPVTGTLDHVQTVAGVANPSFLALNRDQSVLYAGELRLINEQLTHGADPCYVSLDPSGRYAMVANYTGGSVAVLPVAADGGLGPASTVLQHEGSSVRPEQQGAHPHMIAPTPDGQFVLVSDLGTDQVVIYRLDGETGHLAANEQGTLALAEEPGAGPRHFAFAPGGRALYVINELASTLSVYAYDGDRGELRRLQTVSTLPEGYDGENSCAHVAVSPDGRFVYGSNRGHDSIAIWEVDTTTGTVRLVGHESTRGKTPRNFNLDPSGTWLLAANQDSDTVVTFRRDQESGGLAATAAVTPAASPVAILFAGE
jgi:6-phosphogluconolactonase